MLSQLVDIILPDFSMICLKLEKISLQVYAGQTSMRAKSRYHTPNFLN